MQVLTPNPSVDLRRSAKMLQSPLLSPPSPGRPACVCSGPPHRCAQSWQPLWEAAASKLHFYRGACFQAVTVDPE